MNAVVAKNPTKSERHLAQLESLASRLNTALSGAGIIAPPDSTLDGPGVRALILTPSPRSADQSSWVSFRGTILVGQRGIFEDAIKPFRDDQIDWSNISYFTSTTKNASGDALCLSGYM